MHAKPTGECKNPQMQSHRAYSKTDVRLRGVNAVAGDRKDAILLQFISSLCAFEQSQQKVFKVSQMSAQCTVRCKVRDFSSHLGRHGNEVHMRKHQVHRSVGLSSALPRYPALCPCLVSATIVQPTNMRKRVNPNGKKHDRALRRNFLQRERQGQNPCPPQVFDNPNMLLEVLFSSGKETNRFRCMPTAEIRRVSQSIGILGAFAGVRLIELNNQGTLVALRCYQKVQTWLATSFLPTSSKSTE